MKKTSVVWRHLLGSAAALFSAVALYGCGSSGSTYTSPSTLSRCAVGLDAPTSAVPADGGKGVISVKTDRDCTWTAEPDAPWLSITAGRSGQGNGTVEFAAAANSDPVARSADIMLNGTRAPVTQAAAPCTFTLANTSASMPQAGGSGSVDVRASSALCTWTAQSDAEWIAITSGANGKGSARVSFTVAPATGPPRTGALTIAGLHFSITQSEGCAFDVSPLAHNVDASGGTGTAGVNTTSGCPWTATSNAPWISITSGAIGNGAGTVTFAVAATAGPTRTGSLTIAGQTVTVVQGQGCTYAASPDTQTIPSSGGSGSVAVTAGAGCAWTASSGAPWITITSGASGNGSGTVGFTAASTTGPSRSGTITVAGHTVTVVQGQGCTFTISPDARSVPAAGADGTFDVQTGPGCAWTAATDASWLTVTAGASGSGNGTVHYLAAANNGVQRTATITVGGQRFTVRQDAGCSSSISPTSQNVGSTAATAAVDVTAPAGCAWTAVSNVPWITISSGSSGSGNGVVQIVIAANPDAERRGTVTIAGQPFTVVQGSGCTFAITPSGQSVPAAGGAGSFTVNTVGACAWSASANAPWIAITAGASGTGGGTVQFTAAANTGAARSGTITAAGQTFTVTQDTGCSAVVAPDTITAPRTGGSQNVSVTTAAECSWTAVSNAAWIAIAGAGGGSGNGTVQLDIQPNDGPARSGTATIAGRTVSVNQETGCTVSIAPAGRTVPVGGASGSVTVTTRGGCTWTAVSNVAWITVTKGASGSGDGTVEFTVEPNATHAARSGTITIGGQVFTVQQPGA